MAVASVIAAVALMLFLGSLIELWTPLSSFLVRFHIIVEAEVRLTDWY